MALVAAIAMDAMEPEGAVKFIIEKLGTIYIVIFTLWAERSFQSDRNE